MLPQDAYVLIIYLVGLFSSIVAGNGWVLVGTVLFCALLVFIIRLRYSYHFDEKTRREQ